MDVQLLQYEKAQIVAASETLAGLEVPVSEIFRDVTMKGP